MDADVAIRDFAAAPFVIERPATADPFADAATALLARAGLRMDFGAFRDAERRRLDLVQASLPPGFAALGRMGPVPIGTETIVAGPSRETASMGAPDPGMAMACETWTMLGHAMLGTDRGSACAFAGVMAARAGIDRATASWMATGIEGWEWSGPGRGVSSMTFRAGVSDPGRLSSDAAAMAGRIAAAVAPTGADAVAIEEERQHVAAVRLVVERMGRSYEAWSESRRELGAVSRHALTREGAVLPLPYAPEPDALRRELVRSAAGGDDVARAALRELRSGALGAIAGAMDLGAATPDFDDDLDDDGPSPRFEHRPFETATDGPSWLPPMFNHASRKVVQGVRAELLVVIGRAREIAAEKGVRFEVVPVTGGIRTEGMQAALKAKGASKAKTPRHVIGHAADLAPVDAKGRIDYDDARGFEVIRASMKQAAEEKGIAITWGGNWKRFVDKPHWELAREIYTAPGEAPKVDRIATAFR